MKACLRPSCAAWKTSSSHCASGCGAGRPRRRIRRDNRFGARRRRQEDRGRITRSTRPSRIAAHDMLHEAPPRASADYRQRQQRSREPTLRLRTTRRNNHARHDKRSPAAHADPRPARQRRYCAPPQQPAETLGRRHARGRRSFPHRFRTLWIFIDPVQGDLIYLLCRAVEQYATLSQAAGT